MAARRRRGLDLHSRDLDPGRRPRPLIKSLVAGGATYSRQCEEQLVLMVHLMTSFSTRVFELHLLRAGARCGGKPSAQMLEDEVSWVVYLTDELAVS